MNYITTLGLKPLDSDHQANAKYDSEGAGRVLAISIYLEVAAWILQVYVLPRAFVFLPPTDKFVVCPFVDEETNGSYPFANGLNRLAYLYFFFWSP